MTLPIRSGIFIAEGSSDLPLADIIEELFIDRGVQVTLSRPDFAMLPKVKKDVASKVQAARSMLHGNVDVVVIHRDADNAGSAARRTEIVEANCTEGLASQVVPVVPVRMTEAWLLLDEPSIRAVAGNPHGRAKLALPQRREAERTADPKAVLRAAILDAANVTGRRRDRLDRRFSENRRQLLQRLDPLGPVADLPSWRDLIGSIDEVVSTWQAG